MVMLEQGNGPNRLRHVSVKLTHYDVAGTGTGTGMRNVMERNQLTIDYCPPEPSVEAAGNSFPVSITNRMFEIRTRPLVLQV
jgi:hypothetical protein